MYLRTQAGLAHLPGYRRDVLELCSVFWIFGYDLRVYVDLTAREMRKITAELANEKDGSNNSIFDGYSSLIVVILAHGAAGVVCGVDGRDVNIDDLKACFIREGKLFEDKPIFFIIQACRGDKADNVKPDKEMKSQEELADKVKQNQQGNFVCYFHTTFYIHHFMQYQ